MEAEVLTEEKYEELRESLIEHTEVLDNIKPITFFPDDMTVTTNHAANYYLVSIKTIQALLVRNKEVMQKLGCHIISGEELNNYREKACQYNLKDNMGEPFINSRCKNITLITKKGLLMMGMLLKRSIVAKNIRMALIELVNAINKDASQIPELPEKIQAVQCSFDLDKIEEKEQNALDIVNKDILERKKLIDIKSGLKKCSLYGINENTARIIVQKSIINNESIDTNILKVLSLEEQEEKNRKRAIIREQIEYMGTHYFDNVPSVYHFLSDKLRFILEINMEKERARYKDKKDAPSYLDIIADNNCYDTVSEILREYGKKIDEEEQNLIG